jgi:phosphosulfolactate synthase
MTQVLDRMTGLRPEELEYLAPYFDVAKIGWGLPLIVARDRLKERIQLYHGFEIEVSTGGELLEYAVTHHRLPQFLEESRGLGFDQVEVSSTSVDLSPADLRRVVGAIQRKGLGFTVSVGKTDPQDQLTLSQTITRIAEARALRPLRVVLEGRATGPGAGIYDANGGIKWDWVHAILSEHPLEELLFDAPLELQQVQLLRGLGPDVNLGGVGLDAVAPLATDRLGLRGEPFGPARERRAVSGPPAVKFLYYLLESHRSLDQAQLGELSRLPRRTVQSALLYLRRRGWVQESISLEDSRRREYRLA